MVRRDEACLISIVINSLGRGGAERSILLLAEELLRRGERVQIVCLFVLRDEYALPDAVRGHVVRLEAASFAQGLARLHGQLRRVRPRALFSLMPQANLAALLAGRWLGLPVLTSERTTPLLFYAPAAKLNLALLPHVFSARAVFISQYALDHGLPANALGRAVRRNACVLHNPVPSPVPPALAQARRRLRLQRLRRWAAQGSAAGPAPLTLLLASRLVPGKGILEFLRAALELLVAGVRVHIAGAGPLLGQVQDFAAAHGVAAQIEAPGFVEDIHAAYAEADVVVLSSSSEGFGRVGFEAYQAGCLVLGTERNSFGHEIVARTPAWHVCADLAPLVPALQALAQREIPDDGADIVAMQDALQIGTHADRFLATVAQALNHA